MKLGDLIQRGEGKTIEFKRDLSSPDKVLRTLVAFANTAGGIIVIGIDDKTRKVLGLPDVLLEEERIANLISECIQPQLIPDIEVLNWRTSNVLTITVHPSNTRPHYLKRLGVDEGAYIRVGSTNRKAAPPQLEELKRSTLTGSYDEQPLPHPNSEAIDFRVASEFFKPYRNITPASLKTLRIVTEHQGRAVPTIGGLLLFGKDRFAEFPDSWIQAARFAGLNKTAIADSTQLRSYLPALVDDAIAFVRKHLQVASPIEGVRRKERWPIPLVALREALTNAIVHADYSQTGSAIRLAIFDNRIEIENPGLLPFGLTLEDIHQGVSKLRNRVIGRVFHELRLIEHWGSGIERMKSACHDAGLPPPKFEELALHFRVTLYNNRVAPIRRDPMDDKILRLLTKQGPMRTAAIATAIGLSSRATLTRLRDLSSRGAIVEIGMGPHDPKRLYAIAKG